MTAALVVSVLQRLLRSKAAKHFAIVDWLQAHEARAAQAWVAARQDRLELIFLPRYALELNADE